MTFARESIRMNAVKYQIKIVSFTDHLLEKMAADVLSAASETAPADLSDSLVILPSARACRTLGHLLLQASGRETLLLPRTVTLDQLTGERAAALGLSTRPCPAPALRPVILAHALEELPWLQERPESASGLAREFLALFDEARLAGLPELLEAGPVIERVTAAGHPAAAEVLMADLTRVAQVWNIYRQLVPWDTVDLKVAVADRTEGPLDAGPQLVLVGGFGRLDQMQARLLRQVAAGAGRVVLYDLQCAGPLARFFDTTWGPGQRDLSPLAAAVQVRARLTGEGGEAESAAPAGVTPVTGTLRQRLDALADETDWWAPSGPLQLARCANPEDESRLVAHHVVRILAAPGGARQRTAVVTNDPLLADRITAQLRDAGVDVDNTLGRPLSALPAGLLMRFLLRAALTNLRPEALLEVLTHPYSGSASGSASGSIRGDGQKPGRREVCLLRLENDLRRRQVAPSGPDELMMMAAQRDEAADQLQGGEDGGGHPITEMQDFTRDYLAGFAPLLALQGGKGGAGASLHPVHEICAAVRRAWAGLAGRTPLTEDPGRADITGLDRLLAQLERDSRWLPDLSLSGFSAALNRLLGSTNVPPHRTQGLPVQVAGLVEARLERFDHLIVAGLNEGKFPTRGQAPLFLDTRVRRALGLPVRREALARDAELFLRLLHNAPRVLLTWSAADEGQDLLPSPLLERLLLSLPEDRQPELVAGVPLWRAVRPDAANMKAAQAGFRGESLDVPVETDLPAVKRLSWTSLRTWRDCPYRFALEKRFGLRREEEVQEEFSKRDSGNLIHQTMRRFLEPGGAGCHALADDDPAVALAELERCATRVFGEDGEGSAGRALWLRAFLGWGPEVVALEKSRRQEWEPALVEPEFTLPLPRLVEWLALNQPQDQAVILTDAEQQIVLTGAIDRVDRQRGQAAGPFAVLDYKTGALPSVTEVQNLDEMQVLLYALALETGSVHLPEGHPGLGDAPQVTQAFYYELSARQVGPPRRDLHYCDARDLLAKAARRLVDMSRQAAAEAGDFPLVPAGREGEGMKDLPCRFCDFRGACRLEERPGLPTALQVQIDKMVGLKKGGRG